MLATDPRSRHRGRTTGYWLGQSQALRPARRRASHDTGMMLSAVAAAVLLLLAVISQAA